MSEEKALAVIDGGGPPLVPKSMWQMLTEGYHLNPEGPAVIALHQAADHLSELLGAENGHVAEKEAHLAWSYQRLHDTAEELAGAMYARDIRPGDVFVSFVGNGIEYALCFWAAARAGATFCSIDPALFGRPSELQDIFNVIKPRIVVVPGSAEAQKIDAISSDLHLKLAFGGAEDENAANWELLSKFMLDHRRTGSGVGLTEDELNAADEYPVEIVFTSGTTSRPKACASSRATMTYQIREYSCFVETKINDRFLVYTANFRVICRCACMVAWTKGAAVVFPSPLFDARPVLKAVISQRCTHMVAVPAHIHALAQQEDLLPLLKNNDHLKIVVVGGDISIASILDRARQILHPQRALPSWGMSEGGGHIIWDDPQVGTKDGSIPMTTGSVVSIGKVRQGSKVRICQPQTRTPVKRGETGALHVGGVSCIERYLEDRDQESFYVDSEDRWFITGDVAIMDDAGHIYVIGRTKDIIKRKGNGLSPVLIESCLNRHPGVESCVIAFPHATYGEVPVAIIRTQDSGAQLKPILIERSIRELGDESQVEDVLTLGDLQIADFPLNSTGKVMKRDLQKIVKDYYSAQAL